MQNKNLEEDGIPFVECANFNKCKNVVLFEIETYCDECVKEDVEFALSEQGSEIERAYLSSDFEDNTLKYA